nr:AlpA family phage regulatory protein [Aeromonas veronii]
MEQCLVTTTAPALRFIRVREAINKTGLSKSSIYDMMAQGQFPKTVRLGSGRSVAGFDPIGPDTFSRLGL